MTSPTTRRSAASPRELHAVFKEMLEAGDLDGLLTLYEEDAAMVGTAGETVAGIDAIRDSLAPFVAMQAKLTFEAASVHQVGDLALVHAKWTGTGTTPEGPIALGGFTSEVVRRQPDGSWRYLVDDPGIGVNQ